MVAVSLEVHLMLHQILGTTTEHITIFVVYQWNHWELKRIITYENMYSNSYKTGKGK
jgi:hypothetical protein